MQDFHLLIINDCSTDGSVARVEEFFRQRPRQYELVQLPVNGGICHARHFAERHAQTKYLIFVDADDCPLPTLVEKLYSKITSDPDLVAVGCHLEYMDSLGRKIHGGIYLGETTKEGFIAKAAKGKLIFMQPTAIYNIAAALSVGGYVIDGFPPGRPRYRDYCEDLDLWTRMSDLYAEGKAIVVVPEVLCRYRKHPTGMSSNSIGMVLRMRHVKTNVRRRRAGQPDLTFTEFLAQMPARERAALERDAMAADSLHHAFYALRRGHIVASVRHLARSVAARPGYLADKVRHNLLRMK